MLQPLLGCIAKTGGCMGIVPNTPRGRDGPEEGFPLHLSINPLYRFQAVMIVTPSTLLVRGVVGDLHALAVARHAHLIPQNRAVLQGRIAVRLQMIKLGVEPCFGVQCT